MEQKYLKTNLPYRYKFEMYGNANNGTSISAGTLKITDYNGNVIYDLKTGGLGHTLFSFYIDDKKLTLKKTVTYDSYDKGDTTGILDEMSSTTSASSHLYVILSQDAITNDSSFVNRMKAYGCNKDVSCYQQRRGFIAFLHHSGIYYRSDYEGYFLDTSDVVISKNNQESVNLTEYILDMRTARYGVYTPCVILRFIRNPILYSRIYSSTDTDGNNVRIKSEGYESTSSYPTEPKHNFLKLNNSNYLILHNKNNYGRFFGKFKVNKNKSYSISDTLERLNYLDMEELTYDSYDSFESGSNATESGLWSSYEGNNNLNTLCSYVY